MRGSVLPQCPSVPRFAWPSQQGILPHTQTARIVPRAGGCPRPPRRQPASRLSTPEHSRPEKTPNAVVRGARARARATHLALLGLISGTRLVLRRGGGGFVGEAPRLLLRRGAHASRQRLAKLRQATPTARRRCIDRCVVLVLVRRACAQPRASRYPQDSPHKTSRSGRACKCSTRNRHLHHRALEGLAASPRAPREPTSPAGSTARSASQPGEQRCCAAQRMDHRSTRVALNRPR
jgi:hypothetical protein